MAGKGDIGLVEETRTDWLGRHSVMPTCRDNWRAKKRRRERHLLLSTRMQWMRLLGMDDDEIAMWTKVDSPVSLAKEQRELRAAEWLNGIRENVRRQRAK
jgi:hypothetical protein